MIDRIILLMLFIGIGWFLKLFSSRYGVKWIDRFMDLFTNTLYSLFFPLLFFNIFAERGLKIADLSITILVFSYTAISLSILYVLTRGIDVGRRNPIILTATFPNAIFLGFPMVMAICGNIVYASLYGLVILVLNIAVGGLMGLSRSQILQSVMKIPIIYGFGAGVLAHYTIGEANLVITSSTKGVASAISTYGATMIIGYSIPTSHTILSNYYKPAIIQMIYRFIASPAIHYIIALQLNLPIEAYRQIIIESLMPPALTNTIIARVYEWDYEYTASTTLITTLTSLALIPTIATLEII